MIQRLEEKIINILRNDEATRNDDILLTRRVWETYYPGYIVDVIHPRRQQRMQVIALEDLQNVPREDHIKRIRAKIQNERHEYVPTDARVAKQRGFNMAEWRAWALGRVQKLV